MAVAKIIKKRNKKYVAIDCDVCGNINIFDYDRFVEVYAINKRIYCKYCGQELNIHSMDKAIEIAIRRKNKRSDKNDS